MSVVASLSDKPAVLTEEGIRPSEYELELKKALQADLAWLHARKHAFVEVNCPACGQNTSRPAFEKYGFKFSECTFCGTVYMNPRATPELLAEFYSRSELYAFWNQTIFPASEATRREKIARTRVDRILELCSSHHVPTGCLLEVGAGYGTFSLEVQSRNVFNRVIAVEPNHQLANSCRARGLEVLEMPVERVTGQILDVKPNVVTAFEVIEHLFDPEGFLKHCRKLMDANSLIVLTCPNYRGFDISVLGTVSDSLDAEHINLFNPRAIKQLLKRAGFRVCECLTPGQLDVDIVRNKVLKGEFDLSGQPFLKTILLDGWPDLAMKFQKFLQENLLSSHMWVVGIPDSKVKGLQDER